MSKFEERNEPCERARSKRTRRRRIFNSQLSRVSAEDPSETSEEVQTSKANKIQVKLARKGNKMTASSVLNAKDHYNKNSPVSAARAEE